VKALTFQGVRTIGYEPVPDPAILAPGDAIVQVSLAAICGSDLHVYRGREPGLAAGTVMGHELAGHWRKARRPTRCSTGRGMAV